MNPDVWGRWVESAVGAYLLGGAEEGDYRVFYWREKADEVDFIIQRQGEAIAIEVKSGRRGMNSGLKSFREKFQPKRAFVAGTDGMPLSDFFRCHVEDLF
ncbi:MAG: DUF4143 domain-containing protein [Bacteroidaceae bacterium]|nr:DUF4143 domain-containing protein [Bacteroidaceae bacterium]